MKRFAGPVQVLVFVCCALLAASAQAKKPPQEWDGLSLVKLKGLDAAYKLPGADFSIYTKIIIDPIQVAFAKNWDARETYSNRKLSAQQLDDIKGKIQKVAQETFTKVFSEKNGAQIVTEPGPDVLRFSSAIIDVWPSAVDTQEPGRNYTFTASSGSATLYAELRDSETNQLIGRVVDASEARNSGDFRWTNSVENYHEATLLVSKWAGILRKRYDALREASAAGSTTAKQ
ncbi:MAG TPA: DUF3313 family protein [Povalibacter sp.]|nr:DUF3313 family protein [Povalibacter sp.]